MAFNYLKLSASEFTTLNGQLNAVFGYPTEDGLTLTYADPVVNPQDINQVAMLIEDRCLPYLTQEQINDLIDVSTISNWFPGPARG